MRVSPAARASRGKVGGQLDEREVGTDLDRAEVLAAKAAFVRERADDLPRLDLVPTTDLDAVGRGRRSATAIVAAGPVVAVAGRGRRGRRARTVRGAPARAGPRPAAAASPLRDDGERRGDIRLGHVVVAT
jgi:hypothetical protein